MAQIKVTQYSDSDASSDGGVPHSSSTPGTGVIPTCFEPSEAEHDKFFDRSKPLNDREFEYQSPASAWGVQYRKLHWTFVACPDAVKTCSNHDQREPHAHRDAIVIEVAGACRNNGRQGAEAGLGVFVHPLSAQNVSGRLHEEMGITSQRAQLFAGLKALNVARNIREYNTLTTISKKYLPPRGPFRKLRRVVIKTSSKYLVDGMAKWIYKWRQNNFTNAKGFPVANADVFQPLDQAVQELNDLKVEVQFWYVPKGYTESAYSLAQEGLRKRPMVDMPRWTDTSKLGAIVTVG